MKALLLILVLFAEGVAMAHVPRNQSGYVAADFWTQLASVNPRMCTCVKVTSTAAFGSEVVGFTSNTRDMLLPVGHSGVTFVASPGMSPTIVEQALDEAANLEFTGVYNAESFTQEDVLAGKWKFAEIEVFTCCWDNVNLGELLHFKGKLGEFKDYQTYFTVEGRGLIGALSQEVNDVTQRLCRVPFRGTLCGHSASTVTISATSYNISQTSLVPDTYYAGALDLHTLTWSGNIPPDGFYRNGTITAIGGASREIADSQFIDNGSAATNVMRIYLKREFPYSITDLVLTYNYSLVAGCNKTVEDCMKFSNITRFRGEPWIPGLEAANRLPPVN